MFLRLHSIQAIDSFFFSMQYFLVVMELSLWPLRALQNPRASSGHGRRTAAKFAEFPSSLLLVSAFQWHLNPKCRRYSFSFVLQLFWEYLVCMVLNVSRPWISSLTWCCWMCLWSFKFCPFLKIYFESRETKTERDFPSTGFFLKFSLQLGKMKPAAGPPCGWWGPKYLSCFLLAAEACNNRKLETEGLEPTGY